MALATMGLNPSFLRRTVFAQDLLKGAALQRQRARQGADRALPARRGRRVERRRAAWRARVLHDAPDIAIPRPVAGAAQTAIDLDGFFGLHPSLSPFKRLWDDGILAPVHAVGSPSNTRSHFDAQDYMESGTPDNKGTRDGWLNRYLAVKGTCDECKLARDSGDAGHGKASPFQSGRDDAADAAHSRRRRADGGDEQPRRVHDSHERHAGRTHRSAVSHGNRRRRARRGRRDVRGDEDSQDRRTRSSTSRRTAPTIRARRSASTSARSRSSSRRTSGSRSRSPTSAAGTRT